MFRFESTVENGTLSSSIHESIQGFANFLENSEEPDDSLVIKDSAQSCKFQTRSDLKLLNAIIPVSIVTINPIKNHLQLFKPQMVLYSCVARSDEELPVSKQH